MSIRNEDFCHEVNVFKNHALSVRLSICQILDVHGKEGDISARFFR